MFNWVIYETKPVISYRDRDGISNIYAHLGCRYNQRESRSAYKLIDMVTGYSVKLLRIFFQW